VLDSGVIPCGGAAGSDTQAPTTPTGLAAAAANATKVNLTWSASSDNTGVAGYTIYRDGTSLATVSNANLAYSDTTTAPVTSYIYTVDSFDMAGNHSAISAPVSVTTPNMSSSLTFTPEADTYVNAGSTSANYGAATTLRADASPDVHSYLRFNIAGLGGKSIAKARLLIFANSSSTQGVTAQAVADNTWGELTTNYANAPALGNTLASSTTISAGTWVTLDVTSYVTGEGAYSFGIATSGSTAISFASRESSANSPQLIIDLR
jgi:chitodextrinase